MTCIRETREENVRVIWAEFNHLPSAVLGCVGGVPQGRPSLGFIRESELG